jgi:hypothetical protein
MMSRGSKTGFWEPLNAVSFGLLAAAVGGALFGQAVGLVLAVAMGMAVSGGSRCVARIGLGACWGAKSASLEQILNGSKALPLLYALAGAFAVVCLAQCVHAARRAEPDYAQGESISLLWNCRALPCHLPSLGTQGAQIADAAQEAVSRMDSQPHFERATESNGTIRDRLSARR